jgi:hypothetical protein
MNQQIHREQGGMRLMSERTAKSEHGEKEVLEREPWVENMIDQTAALWSCLIESKSLMRPKRTEYGEPVCCESQFLDSRTLRS